MNMNPACIVLFCLESLNRTFGFTVSEIMQRKLMESMSERILPFLRVCSKEDRMTLYRLICKACADPKLIFNRASSNFQLFIKEYDTSDPVIEGRCEGFFPEDELPAKLYGIEYDLAFSYAIQMSVQPNGHLYSVNF
jgi:hypothetical protein